MTEPIISEETIRAIEDASFQRQVDARLAQHGEYLGDGVYARFDGYQVWIEVSDGTRFFNPIALDRGTFEALKRYGGKFYGGV